MRYLKEKSACQGIHLLNFFSLICACMLICALLIIKRVKMS